MERQLHLLLWRLAYHWQGRESWEWILILRAIWGSVWGWKQTANLEFFNALKGDVSVKEAASSTPYGDILSSDITLSSGLEQVVAERRECILKNVLDTVRDEYDYVVIDTPPALNLLTVNAYTASDYLIIPMASDILSLVGLSQLTETIESVRGCL